MYCASASSVFEPYIATTAATVLDRICTWLDSPPQQSVTSGQSCTAHPQNILPQNVSKSNILPIGLCSWECLSHKINCHINCSTFSSPPSSWSLSAAPNNGQLCCAFDMHPLSYAHPHILSSSVLLSAVHMSRITQHALSYHVIVLLLLYLSSRLSLYVNIVSLTSIFNWLWDCQPPMDNPSLPMQHPLHTQHLCMYPFLFAILMHLSPLTMPTLRNHTNITVHPCLTM